MSTPFTLIDARDRWPARLAPPVDPLAATLQARAHSILLGTPGIDPHGLPVAQARDVIAWHEAHHYQQQRQRQTRALWTFLRRRRTPA